MTASEKLEKALTAIAMSEANAVLDGHGVEHVAVGGRELTYVNVGDTYSDTVCAEDGRRWIGSWGAWVEEAEYEYCRENDEIRCGYCGEFTPLCEAAKLEPEDSRPSWRLTVCESCGRGVGDGEFNTDDNHSARRRITFSNAANSRYLELSRKPTEVLVAEGYSRTGTVRWDVDAGVTGAEFDDDDDAKAAGFEYGERKAESENEKAMP